MWEVREPCFYSSRLRCLLVPIMHIIAKIFIYYFLDRRRRVVSITKQATARRPTTLPASKNTENPAISSFFDVLLLMCARRAGKLSYVRCTFHARGGYATRDALPDTHDTSTGGRRGGGISRCASVVRTSQYVSYRYILLCMCGIEKRPNERVSPSVLSLPRYIHVVYSYGRYVLVCGMRCVVCAACVDLGLALFGVYSFVVRSFMVIVRVMFTRNSGTYHICTWWWWWGVVTPQV